MAAVFPLKSFILKNFRKEKWNVCFYLTIIGGGVGGHGGICRQTMGGWGGSVRAWTSIIKIALIFNSK
jgi:hypothetical protein